MYPGEDGKVGQKVLLGSLTWVVECISYPLFDGWFRWSVVLGDGRDCARADVDIVVGDHFENEGEGEEEDNEDEDGDEKRKMEKETILLSKGDCRCRQDLDE